MQKDKMFDTVFGKYEINDDWIKGEDGLKIVKLYTAVKWRKYFINRFTKIGYKFTSIGDIFQLDVRDLSKGSNIKVLKKCPYCNSIKSIPWSKVIKNKSTNCTKCSKTIRQMIPVDEINNVIKGYDRQRLYVFDDFIRDDDGIIKRFCQCICGHTGYISTSFLMSGHTRSCGCLVSDLSKERSADFDNLWGMNHPDFDRSSIPPPNWKGGIKKYYGANWQKQKILTRERDKVCQRCGKTVEENGRNLDVHHIQKLNSFGFDVRVNNNYIQANDLSNLVCLCIPCHLIVEKYPKAINDFRNEKGEIEHGA